jgi:hypothetical protein
MTDGRDFIQGSTHIRFWGAEGDKKAEVENTPLTKREYFAALAMQGFTHNNDKWLADPDVYKPAAECAVNWADALIEALNK